MPFCICFFVGKIRLRKCSFKNTTQKNLMFSEGSQNAIGIIYIIPSVGPNAPWCFWSWGPLAAVPRLDVHYHKNSHVILGKTTLDPWKGHLKHPKGSLGRTWWGFWKVKTLRGNHPLLRGGWTDLGRESFGPSVQQKVAVQQSRPKQWLREVRPNWTKKMQF